MNRLRKLYLIGFLTVLLAVLLPIPVLSQEIRTAHEESNFENYTSFEEMWDFLQKVQASSTEMLLSDFGSTIEGRRQPYAVLSRPLITQPWEANASGKPIVLLAANVHGGERTVRESLLMLTRDLAAEGTDENYLLDDVVVIIAPSINCDGFVRATRGNSRGIDMNRDYIKLEQPALSNFVQNLWLKWQPHIELDGHNGGSYPYNICYQGPAHAASDQRLTELCDQDIFPFVDKQMERQGYKSWYYSGGDRQAWRTGLTDARVNNVYGGFINCISILYESPGGQDRQIGAKSGYVACRALLEYAAENKDKLMECIDRARRETIELGQKAAGDIAIAVEKGPQDYKVSYLIAEGRGEERKIIEVTDALLMSMPIVTKSRPRPYAYILEPRAVKAIELLHKHDILIEVLQEDTELDIEAYKVTNIDYASQYDHPASVAVTCEDDTLKESRTFPKGSFIVRTGQVQGRLVTHMLEPETNDNVITWNSMDALLPRVPGAGGGRGMPDPTIMAGRARFADPNQIAAMFQRAGGGRAGGRTDPEMAQRMRQFTQRQPREAIIPIFKVMTPIPLPTRILKD
ncbi:MAG: hypothetical protein AMJ79_05980 [Phycisphaerae bacterium SM23_30]|nr:MAG: hypothetical protein AMJ79_05980 [Phycisphaerae bacterium SM23_30]